MFLIVVDAHSKWPEEIQMTSTSTEQRVIALRQLYWLPLRLTSDNGPNLPQSSFNSF